MTGTPLQPNPSHEDARIKTRMEPGVATPVIVGDPVTQQDVKAALGEQRPFYLMRADVREAAKKIGFTEGCAGCRAVRLNFSSRPVHTDACRRRMESEIRKTPRGQERMSEFESRLASDVEKRIEAENKIAKTESVTGVSNSSHPIVSQDAQASGSAIPENSVDSQTTNTPPTSNTAAVSSSTSVSHGGAPASLPLKRKADPENSQHDGVDRECKIPFKSLQRSFKSLQRSTVHPRSPKGPPTVPHECPRGAPAVPQQSPNDRSCFRPFFRPSFFRPFFCGRFFVRPFLFRPSFFGRVFVRPFFSRPFCSSVFFSADVFSA